MCVCFVYPVSVGLFCVFRSLISCFLFVSVYLRLTISSSLHAVAGVPLIYVEFVSISVPCALVSFGLILFSVFVFSFSPPLSLLLFSASSPEDSSVSYLMVPKPRDGLSLLRVKGKGLKHKVFHASCEWYAVGPTGCPESLVHPESPSTLFP